MTGVMDGLVAAVSGGASGIGAATVTELRACGATAIALDLTASDDGSGVACDVRDDASVRAAIEQVLATHGRLDVLVNNAGVGAVGGVEDTADAQWGDLLDVNVMGAVRLSRAALPALRASGHGVIVNTCSIAALAGLPQRAAYSTSKGALLALTLAMAADLAGAVRVNAVSPATVDTPWVGRLLEQADDPDGARAALEARQPDGRLVPAEEVARAIAYLASPLSRSTTGCVLTVDGGMTNLRVPPRSRT